MSAVLKLSPHIVTLTEAARHDTSARGVLADHYAEQGRAGEKP